MFYVSTRADVTPPLPMSALAGALCNLLSESEGLEQPCYIGISDTERVNLQFEPGLDSFDAIVAWSQRFDGDAVTISTRPTSKGAARWVESDFDWHGIHVEIYSATPLDEPEHVDYPHEPGRLHGCPACEFRCHCTPDTAECVFDGKHTVPPF
jgi:hypothetical protein